MTGVKISNLPAATTPLSGGELVPVVQSGVTKRATVTQIGTVTATGSTTPRTLPDRFADVVNVKDFGAVGDGVTSDDAAVANAFSTALSQGNPLYFPEGTYLFTSTSTTHWDLTGYEQKGIRIYGASSGRAILNFPNVTNTIGLHIHAPTDWYDFTLADIQIRGATAAPLVAIGKNDFSDPLNVALFLNVIVLNPLNNASAEGMRLNYVVNSNFIGCRANCFANGLGTNVGTALNARQVEFCTFTNGSYGNAAYGVRFVDGFSFGNVFVGTDHENVTYCVSTEVSSAGNNSFVGGQFSLWTGAAFRTTASLSTNAVTVINANYSNGSSPAPIIDATNYAKIRLIDGAGVSTPAVPISGSSALNITGKKVMVVFWGGSISQVTVAGFGIGISSGSVIVEHGQTVGLTYTGAPFWLWQAVE